MQSWCNTFCSLKRNFKWCLSLDSVVLYFPTPRLSTAIFFQGKKKQLVMSILKTNNEHTLLVVSFSKVYVRVH